MSRPVRWWFVLPPLTFLILAACREDPPSPESAEQARIGREVERRVPAERWQAEIQAQRLRTLRVTGLAVLSGGALGALIWLGRPQETLRAGSSPAVSVITRNHNPTHAPAAVHPIRRALPFHPNLKHQHHHETARLATIDGSAATHRTPEIGSATAAIAWRHPAGSSSAMNSRLAMVQINIRRLVINKHQPTSICP